MTPGGPARPACGSEWTRNFAPVRAARWCWKLPAAGSPSIDWASLSYEEQSNPGTEFRRQSHEGPRARTFPRICPSGKHDQMGTSENRGLGRLTGAKVVAVANT